MAIACGAQTTEIVIRSASLTGAQEVPPTGATGTGRGAVIVNPTTKEITGGITFAGLTGAPLDHQQLLATGRNAAARIGGMLRELLSRA